MEASATSEFVGLLLNLLPVVIGALIGIVGGIAGTRYAHRLNTAQIKKDFRAGKLEALVTAVYELELWFKKQENYYLYGGTEPLEHSPFSKVEALAALHFPELESSVEALSTAELNYRGWLLECGNDRLDRNDKIASKEVRDKLEVVYPPYLLAKDGVLKAAKALMKELYAP